MEEQHNATTAGLQEGIALFKKSDWKNALDVFLRVRTHSDVEKKEFMYYIGLCYAKLKHYEEAVPYLEKFISESHESTRVYQCRMTLAYVYIMSRNAKMAEYELTILLNNGFESAQLYATMAYAAWCQSAFPRAIEWYEKALSVDADNLTALNGLGFILADSGKDARRGIRFCKKAVEKAPNNPVYLDSLGWAYFMDGRIPDAKKYLYKALSKAPDSPEIKTHISIVENKKE
ncbi:MAG: tetratricopeptide repeat protein [Treponema sp.]|jgi:tetratricopeptide (TPR) repeat protein|nr:tetratricopeptide repeat protein [Treponema sp.]